MADDVLVIFPRINKLPEIKDLLDLGIYIRMIKDCSFNVRVWMLSEDPGAEYLCNAIRQDMPRIVFYYVPPDQLAFIESTAP